MQQTNLERFADDRISNCLWRFENLSALEEVVRQDKTRIRRLAELSAAQGFGKRVTAKDADSLFASVRSEIDVLLEVEGVPPPVLRGTHFFSPENRETLQYLGSGCACLGISTGILLRGRRVARGMTPGASLFQSVSRRHFLAALTVTVPGGFLVARGLLAENQRRHDAGYMSDEGRIEFPLGRTSVQTEALLAHEYTHHVQKCLGFFPGNSLPLLMAIEGHARGVERWWARQRNCDGQRSVVEHHQLSFRLPELLRTYVAFCDRLGKEPRQELLDSRAVSSLRHSRPDRRFLGYALLRIRELSQGPSIYRDMVHGDLAEL